jgi:hypothetical protein
MNKHRPTEKYQISIVTFLIGNSRQARLWQIKKK